MFGRAQPAGGLAVVALRRRDVSRGAVGRRVGRLATVPSTPKFEILPNLPNVDIFARHSHLNFEENLDMPERRSSAKHSGRLRHVRGHLGGLPLSAGHESLRRRSEEVRPLDLSAAL